MARALVGKAAALGGRGRIEQAIAVCDDVVARFGHDAAPDLRSLVAIARNARTLADETRAGG